jgi:hypothetical protein
MFPAMPTLTVMIPKCPPYLKLRINVEIKCQLEATDEFLLQILLFAQHVSGTFMPIIRSSRVLYKWLLSVVFCAWFSSCCSSPQTGHTTLNSTPYRQLENQEQNTTGSNHLYNTLELLMMGIKVPETCWANNKICNKNSPVASSWHFYFHLIFIFYQTLA